MQFSSALSEVTKFSYPARRKYIASNHSSENLKVNSDLSWINPIQAEYIESKDGKALEFSKQLPFYKSYQDYNRICLTRNNTYRKGMSYSFEHLAIWTRRIKNFDKIRIYFHHPYQAMRTFFNRFYSKPYISLDLQKRRNYNNIRFRFSQLSVLRKRRDANNPCIPDLQDDRRFFMGIFQRVSCVPPFWKKFRSNRSKTAECNNSSQIKKLIDELNEIEWGDASKFLTEPCDKMSISTSVEKSKTVAKFIHHLPVLRFSYLNEDYQEIVNVKDFGFENFWSNIGGFIGIFLGYSLLQIPDLLAKTISFLKKNM